MGPNTTLAVLTSGLITTNWMTALLIVLAVCAVATLHFSLRRHLRISRRFNAIPFDARVTGPLVLQDS